LEFKGGALSTFPTIENYIMAQQQSISVPIPIPEWLEKYSIKLIDSDDSIKILDELMRYTDETQYDITLKPLRTDYSSIFDSNIFPSSPTSTEYTRILIKYLLQDNIFRSYLKSDTPFTLKQVIQNQDNKHEEVIAFTIDVRKSYDWDKIICRKLYITGIIDFSQPNLKLKTIIDNNNVWKKLSDREHIRIANH